MNLYTKDHLSYLFTLTYRCKAGRKFYTTNNRDCLFHYILALFHSDVISPEEFVVYSDELKRIYLY